MFCVSQPASDQTFDVMCRCAVGSKVEQAKAGETKSTVVKSKVAGSKVSIEGGGVEVTEVERNGGGQG